MRTLLRRGVALAAVILVTVIANAKLARERVGRNDRCPCGSGLKYKFCHATSDRLSGR